MHGGNRLEVASSSERQGLFEVASVAPGPPGEPETEHPFSRPEGRANSRFSFTGSYLTGPPAAGWEKFKGNGCTVGPPVWFQWHSSLKVRPSLILHEKAVAQG